MMGVTDIVKLKVDATTDTRQVIPQINALARAMTKSFYENMKSSLQKQFHQFLWVTLNDLWKMGSREVKDSVASAVGEILLSLGPFYGGGLMESLLAVINGEESCSTLLFASFAYLSRFFTGPDLLYTFCPNHPIFYKLLDVLHFSGQRKPAAEFFHSATGP